MGRYIAHYRHRSTRRRLLAVFPAVFGGLWIALEPAGLFLPDAFDWGWAGYLSLLVASAALAILYARPRDEIARALPPTDVRVAIRVGDILGQTGNVIVGSNDVFDTQLEDEVISPVSLQGQLLLRVFEGNRAELDDQIDASLAAVDGTPDPDKTFGKRDRYPIGTVAMVRRGSSRYFLPAFARMSTSMPANVRASIEELEIALAKTWQATNVAGQHEPVHAPIVGSRLARLGVSRTLLAQMIILSFIAATRSGGPPSLTLWISPHDRDDVDMLVLDDWLRGLCTA
jgi:hypothetical protein